MTIRLTDERAEALDILARVDGVSMNEVISLSLDERIASRRKNKIFQHRLRAMVEENHRALEMLK